MKDRRVEQYEEYAQDVKAEPKKPHKGGIQIELEQIHRQVEEIDAVLVDLYDRIKPILMPFIPEQDSTKDEPEANSNFANQLAQIKRRMIEQRRGIERILDSVDL